VLAQLPQDQEVNDSLRPGRLDPRLNGSMIHDMYLMQVKSPGQVDRSPED
jgi:hypothetical protein